MAKLNINYKSDIVKGYDITRAEIKDGRKVIARLWYPSGLEGSNGFCVELTYYNRWMGLRSGMDLTEAVTLLKDNLYKYYLGRLHDINAALLVANQINIDSFKAI